MKFVRQYWDSTLLMALTWCILNGDFTITTIASGFIAAGITVFLVRMLFSDNDDIKNYRIQPYLLIWFIVVLFYHIVKSGIATSFAIFRHQVSPVVVELDNRIHNHWFQCLVANSITLTPGTVTIDKTDHKLKVLWLYPTTDNKEEQAKVIFGAFESILKRGDFNR